MKASDADTLRREILTPEGVPIYFSVARAGDRAAAFMIDMLIIFACLLGLGLSVGLIGLDESSTLTALIVVAAFLLLNFYFTYFELRRQGVTPGKKSLRIRLIDGQGGQLEPSAVFVRNFMRELELWTPIRILAAGRTMWPDAPAWVLPIALIWVFAVLLFPLFNKDRLRLGDLVAGTKVVQTPKAVLLTDVAATVLANATDASRQATPAATSPGAPNHSAAAKGAPGYAFTAAQLDVYGEFELQVLEELLRDADPLRRDKKMEVVATSIGRKIGYGLVPPHDRARFLEQFYVALRGHLEKRRLLGKRKADKFAR